MSLLSKVEALGELAAESAPIVDADSITTLDALAERARGRVSRSEHHVVVGLFGATGSGKSSLLNALTGQELSPVAVRRPTTGQPVAAIVTGPGEGVESGAHELLDWLDVTERHIVSPDDAEPGLVLIDMPDFDSVEREHRLTAERLSELVDVVVWVSDPQKYADRVLHTDFVQQFTAHNAVTVAVVNQIDRLDDADADAVLTSFANLLAEDGLLGVEVIATSATTGEGVHALMDEFRSAARRKDAMIARVDADLRTAAADFAPKVGAEAAASKRAAKKSGAYAITGLPETVPPEARESLVDACSQAAQTHVIAKAVGDSYRKRSTANTGWPLTRWLTQLKADPLERMRLGRGRQTHRRADTEEEFIARSSMTIDAPGAAAHISRGVDAFADKAAGSSLAPWPRRLRSVVHEQEEKLPDDLDYELTRTQLPGVGKAWWWLPLNVIQWLSLLVALLGLGWLLALAALGFFGVPQPDMPMIGGLWVPLPVPTAMIVLGVGLGIVLAVLTGLLNRIIAARIRSSAEARLRESIGRAVDGRITVPAAEEIDRAHTIADHLSTIAAPLRR